MKYCYFTLLLLLASTSLFSQHYFVKGFGDSLYNETISKIVKYDDTTFFICGYIDNPSSGKRGYIISKADSNFNLKWNKYYENFRFLNPKNFFLGSDSLLYSTGTYIDTNFLAKTALIKLDLNGDTLYSINLGDSIGDYYLKYVAENHDTLYFSGSRGSTNYEGVLVGINKLNGSIVRSHSFTRNIGTNIVIHEGVFDSLSNKFYFLCKVISAITNDYTIPAILSTNLDGSFISFHTLGDSANFNHYIFNHFSDNSGFIVGYNTPNQNNLVNDFQYTILDSNFNFICTNVLQTLSTFASFSMLKVDDLSSTNTIRLYNYSQIIEIDLNCNIINNINLHSNPSLNWVSQSLDSYLTDNNTIYSSGYYQETFSPRRNYLVVKSMVNGDGCNSTSLFTNSISGSNNIDSSESVNKNNLQIFSSFTPLIIDTISLPSTNFCEYSVNILENEKAFSIIVYPIPFEDQLNISNLSNGNFHIQIYTMTGQRILDTKVNNTLNHILIENLSFLPSAMYVLKITDNSFNSHILKIIKK